MEVDLGQPFAVRENYIGTDPMTIIDLIIGTETKHLHGTETEIKTNITKVEEIFSLANSTRRHDSMVQDLCSQLLNRLWMT
jgi:hypothetical protein